MSPGVVPELELHQKRGEESGAVDWRSRLDEQRRRGNVDCLWQRFAGDVYVDADAEHHAALARFGEDARDLAAVDQEVVRESHLGPDVRHGGDGVRRGQAGDDRELGEPRGLDFRPEVDRGEHARPGRRVPGSAEPAAPGLLLLGDGDRALGCVRRELTLGRLTALEVEVGTAEPAAKKRLDHFRRNRVGSQASDIRLTGLPTLTREDIEAILPHRDPFLLLDEIIDLEPGERVVARKRVRPDEWYLAGHFPGRPIMPGVLIVEAMAQAGAVAVLSEEANRGKLALFAGIDGVRFKRVVEPGDELELTCVLERVRGPIGRGKATATVDGDIAARGTLTFAVER